MPDAAGHEVPLDQHLRALRLQGRFEDARAVIASVARQQPALAALAGRLAREHEAVWWSLPAGRRSRLRRRGSGDLSLIRRLWAAPGFVAHFNPASAPLPEDDAALERILANEHAALPGASRALHWVIETTAGHGFGVASLVDISFAHRRAEFLIGVVDPPYRGAAAEATLLAVDFAFGPLGLQKLVGLVPAHNAASLTASEHIGFQSEGVLRRHIVDPRTRAPIDVVHMAMLAAEPATLAAQQRVRRRLLQEPIPAWAARREA